jgi:hypothetical protein
LWVGFQNAAIHCDVAKSQRLGVVYYEHTGAEYGASAVAVGAG